MLLEKRKKYLETYHKICVSTIHASGKKTNEDLFDISSKPSSKEDFDEMYANAHLCEKFKDAVIIVDEFQMLKKVFVLHLSLVVVTFGYFLKMDKNLNVQYLMKKLKNILLMMMKKQLNNNITFATICFLNVYRQLD